MFTWIVQATPRYLRNPYSYLLVARLHFLSCMLVGDLLAGLKSRAHWLWAGAWFVFVCISYTILSDALLTGYSTRKSQIQTEIPLLGLLFGFLYASLRRGPFRPVLASLPFIGFYVCCDVFYAAFGKALRFVDFRLLPEVLTVFSAQERAFSA
ncbi:MAG: hypothetical protein GY725_13150, partial [bacterium]|nr:hypothetical protein [bacterium]